MPRQKYLVSTVSLNFYFLATINNPSLALYSSYKIKKCSYSYNTIRTLSCFNIFYSKYRLVPYNNIPIANYINLSCSTFISNKLIPLHSMGKQKVICGIY